MASGVITPSHNLSTDCILPVKEGAEQGENGGMDGIYRVTGVAFATSTLATSHQRFAQAVLVLLYFLTTPLAQQSTWILHEFSQTYRWTPGDPSKICSEPTNALAHLRVDLRASGSPHIRVVETGVAVYEKSRRDASNRCL